MSLNKINKKVVLQSLPATKKLDYDKPNEKIEIINLDSSSSSTIEEECIFINSSSDESCKTGISFTISSEKFEIPKHVLTNTANTNEQSISKNVAFTRERDQMKIEGPAELVAKTTMKKSLSKEQAVKTKLTKTLSTEQTPYKNATDSPRVPFQKVIIDGNISKNVKTLFVTNRRKKVFPESESCGQSAKFEKFKKTKIEYRTVLVEQIQKILDCVEKWKQFQYKFFERSSQTFGQQISNALRYANKILAEDIKDFLLLIDSNIEPNKSTCADVQHKWTELQASIDLVNVQFDELDTKRQLNKGSPNSMAIHEGNVQIPKKTRSRIPILSSLTQRRTVI